MLIHDIITRGARLHPQRTALKHGDHAVSYRQLAERTEDVAQRIREHGLCGAHGGLLADNSIDYAAGFFSIAKAGGVVVPTNPALPAARLPGDLTFSDVEYVITQPQHAARVRAAAASVPRIKLLIVLDRGGRAIHFEPVAGRIATVDASSGRPTTPDEAAVLFATSGTAAEPKRVLLSHRNLLANVSSFLSLAGLAPINKALIVLPMTAIGTCTTELLAYLAAGLAVRVYGGVFVLGEFCRLLEEEQIQVINVTPFILNLMLAKSAEVAPRSRSLRKVFFASAPMPTAQFARLIQDFAHVQFYYGYGQTEASPRCTTLLPIYQRQKLGSVGTPLRDVEVRIVDERGHIVPAGEVGEVVVRGPNVMLGYYKRPDLTAQTIPDGWLRTGDRGYLDDDGFLFIKGRSKNVLITRGICVNPEEVELEIMGHPDVDEAYVTARSDDRVGEQIVAYVVRRDGAGLDQHELKSFLRERLDPVKIPARIEFVTQLQRNYNHKLLRT